MSVVNPPNQNASTMYIRVYAASQSRDALSVVPQAFSRIGLGHFPGEKILLKKLTPQASMANPFVFRLSLVPRYANSAAASHSNLLSGTLEARILE